MTDPVVSVVIPTYNRAELVDRCVASLERSGVEGIEVIVVDDGGTDNTEEVIRGRAQYIRQVNAGPAAARNNGFSESRGHMVCFIDSDDEWSGDAAVRVVAQLESNPDVDVVFADSLMGNRDDGFVSFVETYGREGFLELPAAVRDDDMRVLRRSPFFRQLSTRNVMFLGSTLIRRRFFEAVGGFDPTLRGAADWEFFMRAAVSGTVAFSPGPAMSVYYKHSEGMSTDSDHMEHDFIRALDRIRSNPNLSSAERAHTLERLRHHVFGWAWEAYDRGDSALLRQRLMMAADLRVLGVREAAYLAASYLPQSLVRVARRARRLLSAN